MNRKSQHPQPTVYESKAVPALEAHITRALSQAPPVSIPEDFAATVARRASAQAVSRVGFLSGWGPRLALFSSLLLTVAMFVLAPHATPSLTNLPFDAELLLLAELSALLLFADRILSHD